MHNAIFILANLLQRSFFNSKGLGFPVLVVSERSSAPRDPQWLGVHLSFVSFSCERAEVGWLRGSLVGLEVQVLPCRRHIAVSCFSTRSDSPCLLTGAARTGVVQGLLTSPESQLPYLLLFYLSTFVPHPFPAFCGFN